MSDTHFVITNGRTIWQQPFEEHQRAQKELDEMKKMFPKADVWIEEHGHRPRPKTPAQQQFDSIGK